MPLTSGSKRNLLPVRLILRTWRWKRCLPPHPLWTSTVLHDMRSRICVQDVPCSNSDRAQAIITVFSWYSWIPLDKFRGMTLNEATIASLHIPCNSLITIIHLITDIVVDYTTNSNTNSRSRKQRLTAVGVRCADHATPSTRKIKVGINFADKRWSLSRYSSLAD
jgi:hypothetical protein